MRHPTACVLVLVVLAAPIAVRPSPAEDKPAKPAAEAAATLVLLKPGETKDLTFTFRPAGGAARTGWFVGRPGKAAWHEPKWEGDGIRAEFVVDAVPKGALPDGQNSFAVRVTAGKDARPGLVELRYEVHHGATTAGELRVLVVAP